MNSLIEIIFRGVLPSINLDFLKGVFLKAKELYFNSPEISSVNTFDEAVEIINSNAYIDLAINTDELSIYGKNVPKVFINLGRNNDEIEILFFFDLKDLCEPSIKESIDFLEKWALEFKNEHKFDYFICQTDNANKEEYYFDSHGKGKLYDRISSLPY